MKLSRTLACVAVLGLAIPIALPRTAGRAMAGEAVDAPEPTAFEVVAEDGTVLRGHVYLPEGRGPFGTILDLSPYWNTGLKTDSDAGIPENMLPFHDAGFAVALINMRGAGISDGCLQFGDATDTSDARAVIDELAEQEWSSGAVGMFGGSYEGWSQWLAAADPPKALKALVVISGVIEPWELITRRGAPMQGVGPTFAPIWTGATSYGGTGSQSVQHAACENAISNYANVAQLGVDGAKTEWFQKRDLRKKIESTKIPALVTNGLMRAPPDKFVPAEGHIHQFDGLWELLRPDRTRFMLGQWGHAPPDRKDFPKMAVAWFDHYLRGGPQRIAPGVVEYEDDTGEWHSSRMWPPPSTDVSLHLSDSALVENVEAVEESEISFQSVDEVDPGFEQCGGHQALYVSEPLKERIELAGYFRVELSLSSTLPGGNLAVMLSRGEEASCPAPATEISRAIMDLNHYKTPGEPEDFPTDGSTTVRLDSQPFAGVVPAGERLVVAIGGGAFEVMSDLYRPVLTVGTGDGLSGSITVPVVAGRLLLQGGRR